MYKKEKEKILEKIKTLKKKLVDFFSIKSLKGITNVGIDHIDYKVCKSTIEYGKLQSVVFPNVAPMVNMAYIPSDKENFELIKLPTNRTGLPIGVNYKIRYNGEYNKDTVVYLELNWVQIFRIKWELKELWYQSREFKITLAAGLFISLFAYILANNEPTTEPILPETKPSNIHLETSIDSSDFELESNLKNDTIIKNSK